MTDLTTEDLDEIMDLYDPDLDHQYGFIAPSGSIPKLVALAREALAYREAKPTIIRVLAFEASIGTGDTPIRLGKLIERLP